MYGPMVADSNRPLYVNHVFYIKTIFSALIISTAVFCHVNSEMYCVVIVAKLHFLLLSVRPKLFMRFTLNIMLHQISTNCH